MRTVKMVIFFLLATSLFAMSMAHSSVLKERWLWIDHNYVVKNDIVLEASLLRERKLDPKDKFLFPRDLQALRKISATYKTLAKRRDCSTLHEENRKMLIIVNDETLNLGVRSEAASVVNAVVPTIQKRCSAHK